MSTAEELFLGFPWVLFSQLKGVYPLEHAFFWNRVDWSLNGYCSAWMERRTVWMLVLHPHVQLKESESGLCGFVILRSNKKWCLSTVSQRVESRHRKASVWHANQSFCFTSSTTPAVKRATTTQGRMNQPSFPFTFNELSLQMSKVQYFLTINSLISNSLNLAVPGNLRTTTGKKDT